MAKILVVDDSAFSRQLLRGILTQAGFEIAGSAKDGDEAIFLYEILRPDVVTLDLTMPKVGGLEAMAGILAFDPGAQIVVCSALGGTHNVREALLAGARDFVVKPFAADRVIDAVNRAWRAKERN